ncbi:F-box/FBD/LRR-repeat protein At1g13570-like [Chenopodium quinoa]|uniref:FBD domain-containing protein n=1 Tax=Chenopodium quinoa TaxID=63459 RepID=A0A803L7G3_CHEQI|nr:F-box/FBD/LRR-repeat protein At1g13570-like [Chenopodium quinoa]
MSAVAAAINNRSCVKDADRISNLPLDSTHKILQRLPLKEAAKTSVLSQHWRFQWASNQQLILDESFCKSIQEGRNESADISLIYSNVVNKIILSHVGPISKFVLYVPSWFPGETYIWIRCVCAHDVKELTLVFAPPLLKNLPTCLFSCSGLTHSTLKRFKLLSLPPTFTGFPCLIHLEIEANRFECIDAKMLESCISRCPQLESLHLMIYEPVNNLTILAPKLKDLLVRGCLNSLCIKGAMPTIKSVVLDSGLYHSDSMNKIISSLASVEMLVLGTFVWQYFHRYNPPRNFPIKFGQLRTLNIVDIYLHTQSQFSFVLYLFASSPKLERLSIQVKETKNGNDAQIKRSFIFESLRKVKLSRISGWRNELQLLEYILAHSPVLEEMTIELSTNIAGAEEKFNFATEAMRYRRSSPNAELKIKTK